MSAELTPTPPLARLLRLLLSKIRAEEASPRGLLRAKRLGPQTPMQVLEYRPFPTYEDHQDSEVKGALFAAHRLADKVAKGCQLLSPLPVTIDTPIGPKPSDGPPSTLAQNYPD